MTEGEGVEIKLPRYTTLGTIAHHRTHAQCMHPDGVARYGYLDLYLLDPMYTASGQTDQVYPSPLEPTPSLLFSPTTSLPSLPLACLRPVPMLHQPPKPPLFRRLPQRKNHDHDHDHGWERRTATFDSSMHAPCPVDHRLLRVPRQVPSSAASISPPRRWGLRSCTALVMN